METIIVIPARMASTRFPGKPMAKINGIPMIQMVWQQAIAADIGDVYVACSEKEVEQLIFEVGGQAIMTEPDLPSGTDRIYAALKKINIPKNLENVINLQGDMPLIKPEYISKTLEPLKNNFTIGTLATNLEDKQTNDPNITKVRLKWTNNKIAEAEDFFRDHQIDDNNIYHHVGIYSYTLESLNKFINLPKSKSEISLNLEQLRAMDANIKIGVSYVPNVHAGIDTKEDLIKAENIILKKNERN